jgi:hypothetical protein
MCFVARIYLYGKRYKGAENLHQLSRFEKPQGVTTHVPLPNECSPQHEVLKWLRRELRTVRFDMLARQGCVSFVLLQKPTRFFPWAGEDDVVAIVVIVAYLETTKIQHRKYFFQEANAVWYVGS